jgi:CRP/FNR family transcriptional regulator
MNHAPDPPTNLAAIIEKGQGLLSKLFRTLPPSIGSELLASATLRDLPMGTVVLDRGMVSSEIGYVIHGILGMIQIVDPSRRHIVGILVPTDIYGRIFDGPAHHRIEALVPTRVLVFQRAAFEQVLRRNPSVERLFLVHLLDEMDAAHEWLLLISCRKVINRVASFLTIVARRAKSTSPSEPLILRLPFPRKELAHFLGASKESLSRAFHELQTKGVIRILDAKTFEIPDLSVLTAVSGDHLSAQKA